jgi:hypothetical protein
MADVDWLDSLILAKLRWARSPEHTLCLQRLQAPKESGVIDTRNQTDGLET